MKTSFGIAAASLTIGLGAGCAPTFLQRAAAEPGMVRLPSGSVMRVLQAGDGPAVKPSDKVRLTYEARFPDGTVFASSRKLGAVDVVTETTNRCWREALVRMHLGDRVKLVCVSELAQSETGPQVPDDTTVAFELSLLAPGSEEEVNLPEGLVYKSIKPGTGERPRASDTVKVHYEGRLADGTVFDSSLQRGAPVTFPLGGVIECWRYGLQKMHVGEKAELVCPPDIAYGAKGSPPNIPPNATLTFEVELLGVERGSPPQ